MSAAKILRFVSMALGLAIALMGLLNVMPDYGVLPRIGPFPTEPFRAIFFATSCLCLLSGMAARALGATGAARAELGVIAMAAVAVLIVSREYWRVNLELANSMVLFGAYDVAIAMLAAVLVIYLCWRIWGVAIAAMGMVALGYLIWGQYLPGFLASAPADFAETVAGNVWFSTDQGILGSVMAIVLSTVLPFIILGGLLDGVGAGKSMIRISFSLMRRYVGGPAYAAIVSSALFGTVSGSAVANVVGTGVVTIPMIKRRGYSAKFAGAVEAAASTGGQVLPPIMGAAALVMADLVGVSYLTVAIAAIVPSIAYYLSLVLAVYFHTRRLGIQVNVDETDPDLVPDRQDYLNMLLVFGPIALIVWLLVIGMSPAGASIAAILILIPGSFINPALRRRPALLLGALADGGVVVARLAAAIAVVGIVVATMSATGIPTRFSVLLSSVGETSMLFSLAVAALGCIVLGMGMPTLPAYIAIVVVMGPALQKFGLEPLTIHFFVFFYGIASAITPPVAIASYAAASIAGGPPIATSVESSKVGAMIFVIPFSFAFNPELLLVQAATDYTHSIAAFGFALFSLLVAMWMFCSALMGQDRNRLGPVQRLGRVVATALLVGPGVVWSGPGLALAAVLIAAERLFVRKTMSEIKS